MSDTHVLPRLPLALLPTTVLPGTTVTLGLDDPAVRAAVTAARERHDGRLLLRGAPDATLGVMARVPDVGQLPGGQPAAIVQVDRRARLSAVAVDLTGDVALTAADAEVLTDPKPTERVEAATRELRATLELIAEHRRSRRLPAILRDVHAPGALADAVATWAEFDDEGRRRILEAVDVAERVDAVHSWARNHLGELQVAETIRNDVSEGMDRQQREFLLRQQLNSIRKELGEGDDDVVGEFRTKLEALGAPTGVKNQIAKELDRFERMSSQSPEHSWVRTWLDRVFEMPWGQRSDDRLDLAAAREVLDADHYGLDDVKARIVEFLATRKLRSQRGLDPRTGGDTGETRRGDGAIITLVGPPGVGKTSVGESIARAMGRKFVRVALGGIRDEAEIRGHRRTYVGSQPGRLVRALQEAGTMNPVILLDEVDKLAAGGWSGDPTAALLEVLDPAQNHTFRDHYLEVDLDLSEVVFIATANVADTIPGPLLDRMDIVRLDGYTEDEKVFIAERYLLPRQLERAGLRDGEVTVPPDTIAAVVRGWTREAGVRSLERELSRLARKAAARIAVDDRADDDPSAAALTIAPAELPEWLGRAKVDDGEIAARTEAPGIATGLAVTGVGGDVLFVETTAFPTGPDAEPGLTLTGQLGDVMKESAQIALNYVRSHAAELGIDAEQLQRRFHVHVPAGAVPKDGPSAGITMTTALVSLLTDRRVNPDVAMTGEITLQGQVLPIGGVKQKVLAAHRMGLRTVVLPQRNGPDIDDVPERVRNEMTFHLADTYAQVAAAAFA
ncbi:MAG TPA: endopeptidase La [Ilumatobacter sp.]|nr:endopeptidase La [Ilumatobacter sp.]